MNTAPDDVLSLPNFIETINHRLDSKCFFIMAEQGKWAVKDHLKPLGAVYNGVGWFVDAKHRHAVEQLCQQANMRFLEWPLNGETFEKLKQSHKLSFFQERSIKLRLRMNALRSVLGIVSIDFNDLIHGEQRTDLERLPEGKELINTVAEYQRFQEQIKRVEEEERIGNITINDKGRFQYLLEPYSEQQVRDEIRNTSPGISVGYKIGDIDIKIPGGALSIVALPTGHGKTATLINFALGALNHQHDKSVYFFTYEENSSSILVLFLNTYIGRKLSKNNRESIQSYFRNDTLQHFDTGERENFIDGKREFFENIVDIGRLNVRYTEMSTNELVASIRFLRENTNAGLVCIDYVQFLKLVDGPTSRQEQLKEICIILKDVAVATGLPILLGAQFNRTVVGERDLSPVAIGEAGDIERAASLILGGWNRTHVGFSRDGNVNRSGEKLPVEHAIYLEILKGRGIGHGHCSVLDFDGNTGKLSNRISDHRPSHGQGCPAASHLPNRAKDFITGRNY